MKPLCIDLFCGLGGWAEGFLAHGYDVVGFDIEVRPYPGQLVIQDVITLHGSQFRNAAVIVASPPCQEFSYMAMPWSLAKAKAAAIRADETGAARRNLTALFDACFRIQREASEAAGRYIPMVVENVKGAQPWVGPAKARFGSFYLWGAVESVGGRIVVGGKFGVSLRPTKSQKFNPDGTEHGQGSWFKIADSKNRGAGQKNDGGSWFAIGSPGQTNVGQNPDGRKVPGMNFHDHAKTGKPGRSFQSAAVKSSAADGADGVKCQAWSPSCGRPATQGGHFGKSVCDECFRHGLDKYGALNETDARLAATGIKQHGSGPEWWRAGHGSYSSKSSARKMASAQIAKIPFALAEHIAQTYKPEATA